ncbi:MAG TPA: SRPBCC family protein [Pilimelia sp.]|nr:SRPBCC family protein [Pilimelia sp.]
MNTIHQSVEVRVPVHAAYEQLADLESYPRFMTGVREVRQVSADVTHWVMELGGRRTEFDARITDCTLDKRVAWRATGPTRLAEAITLAPLGADRTRIVAELSADARALLPSDAHAEEALRRRLKADLDGLKRYLETGETATGADAMTGGAGAMTGAAGAAAGAADAMTGAAGAAASDLAAGVGAAQPAAGAADLGGITPAHGDDVGVEALRDSGNDRDVDAAAGSAGPDARRPGGSGRV